MAGVAKKHLVDGEWVTAAEVAERLGVPTQSLYNQMNTRRVSLQVVVNMIRENLIMNGQATGQRHMVDGKWMTKRQAAEMLGVTREAINDYMAGHRCTLQEAVDAYREGRVHRGGRKPVDHRVKNTTMTAQEAAEKLGVSVNAVRVHMHKHKASLAATIRYYEKRKIKQAEKDILAILMEGRS